MNTYLRKELHQILPTLQSFAESHKLTILDTSVTPMVDVTISTTDIKILNADLECVGVGNTVTLAEDFKYRIIHNQIAKIEHELAFSKLAPVEVTLLKIRKELLEQLLVQAPPATPYQPLIEMLPYNMGKALELLRVANTVNNSDFLAVAQMHLAQAVRTYEDTASYMTIAKLQRLYDSIDYELKYTNIHAVVVKAIEMIIQFQCEDALAHITEYLSSNAEQSNAIQI